MIPTFLWIIAIALAYLAGSIPFGFLIAKTRGIDIRDHGSGNIGATNVRRVLGKPCGNLCFALDFLKGALPVLIAGNWLIIHQPADGAPKQYALGNWSPDQDLVWKWLAVAVAAIAGHMFPIWLKGKGGKGIATGFGAMLAMYPVATIPAILALIAWIIIARASRYVSLASCAAAMTLPIGVLLMACGSALFVSGRTIAQSFEALAPVLIVTLALALVIIYRHRANLRRISAGTEPRIGDPHPSAITIPTTPPTAPLEPPETAGSPDIWDHTRDDHAPPPSPSND